MQDTQSVISTPPQDDFSSIKRSVLAMSPTLWDRGVGLTRAQNHPETPQSRLGTDSTSRTHHAYSGRSGEIAPILLCAVQPNRSYKIHIQRGKRCRARTGSPEPTKHRHSTMASQGLPVGSTAMLRPRPDGHARPVHSIARLPDAVRDTYVRHTHPHVLAQRRRRAHAQVRSARARS